MENSRFHTDPAGTTSHRITNDCDYIQYSRICESRSRATVIRGGHYVGEGSKFILLYQRDGLWRIVSILRKAATREDTCSRRVNGATDAMAQRFREPAGEAGIIIANTRLGR